MQGVPPLLKVATWLSAGICMGMQMPADMVWWPWVLASLGAALLFSRSERWQSGCLMACVVLTGACIAAWQRQSLRFPFTDNMQRIEAVVTSEPVAREKSVRVDLLLTENGRQIKGYLAKDERSLSLQPGEGLLLYTRIKPNRQWRQGTFDYAHYLETHGITGSCYASARQWRRIVVSLTRLSRAERLRLWALSLRHRLLSRYGSMESIDEQGRSVLAAMTLGDKSALSGSLREVYAHTGASHVLALSGLHLGILCSLLTLLTRTGHLRFLARLCTALLLWSYALLTGLSPSVVRSATMLTVFLAFSFSSRRQTSAGALGLAAILLMLAYPLVLYDIGFQLSFAAVLSILILVPEARNMIPAEVQERHRPLKWLWSVLLMSLAAQAGTAPLVAYHFGTFPLYFLLTNLIVIPAVYLILWGTLLLFLIPWPLISQALGMMVTGLNSVLSNMSQWPCACITGLSPTLTQVVLCYVFMGTCLLIVRKVKGEKIRTL